MPSFLFHLSNVQLFIFLSSLSIIVSITAILLIRCIVSDQIQYRDNPVIGNISGLISIIYGVLTGLIALYLINNISYTGEVVQNEVNAIANIYRESKWLEDSTKQAIQDDVKKYLYNVVDNDWPKMIADEPLNSKGTIILHDLSKQIREYNIVSKKDEIIVPILVSQVQELYNAREQRIRMSFSQLNTETYVVILIGTILTIGISCLFGMNIYLHMVTVSATALMAASMLFLIVTLDRPFVGNFTVGSEGFLSVIHLIEKTESNGAVDNIPI